jgi:hypothetical protein
MNKMKTLLTLLIAIVTLISTNVFAQGQIGDPNTINNPIQTQPNGRNLISCSAYDSITYNSYTINQINATDGNNSSVQSLWGANTSVTNNDTSRERVFKFGSNIVAFNTEFDLLTNIEITNSQWPVKILGKEIRVGDSFEEMKQKFGSNLKIIYKPEIDSNYVATFNCSNNDYDGILIDFNTATHQIMKIIYFKNP